MRMIDLENINEILNSSTACDAAGPEYYFYDFTTDAKKAAKNVQGIHTSIILGTMTRNCHQDFIMGKTSK
jgi:hypothetical protein